MNDPLDICKDCTQDDCPAAYSECRIGNNPTACSSFVPVPSR